MGVSPSPPLLPITHVAPLPSLDREQLLRRARLLARAGLAWHVVEAAVAVLAGVLASSVALVGFGTDSFIEAAAGLVVLWLMSGARTTSRHAERRAQHLIAGSFALLATYLVAQTLADLIGGAHPGVSRLGIALSIVTLLAMPPLAAAKRRVGVALASSATVSESRQTLLCAYLSAGLLGGLLANAVLGWWWADLLVAVAIAVVAIREARNAWRGEACGCC
ncbi:MAG: cobalt transporter [Solirubrobacteraceae bacterium]